MCLSIWPVQDTVSDLYCRYNVFLSSLLTEKAHRVAHLVANGIGQFKQNAAAGTNMNSSGITSSKVYILVIITARL